MIASPKKMKLVGFWIGVCIGLGCFVKTYQTQPNQLSGEQALNMSLETDKPAQIGKGFPALVKPGAITILGELHGTREISRLVSDLERASAQSVPLVVGVEAPKTLTPMIELFMNSPGAASDIAALLTHRFWKFNDGRGSQALLQLLIEFRQRRKEGRLIDVFAFDVTEGPDSRDEGMAENIVEKLSAIEIDKAAVLIVTGNLHARIDNERWMGWHLQKVFADTVSLNNAHSGGTAWVCTKDGCGPKTFNGVDRGKEQFVERKDSEKWQGIFYLGKISASAPAKN